MLSLEALKRFEIFTPIWKKKGNVLLNGNYVFDCNNSIYNLFTPERVKKIQKNWEIKLRRSWRSRSF